MLEHQRLPCGRLRGDPLDQERTAASAIAAGVNYFDTAVLYGNGESEKNLGRVLGNLKATNVVVGTKVRLPNAELGRIADAVATSLEGSLGATALRSGWHPFICTRDHRHGRRDMLGVRQVLEDVVPAFRVAAAGGYDSLFIARFLPFRDRTSAALHCRYSRRCARRMVQWKLLFTNI